jgi:prophage regulatory protein
MSPFRVANLTHHSLLYFVIDLTLNCQAFEHVYSGRNITTYVSTDMNLRNTFQTRFLRLPEVRTITGLSKSTIYVRISEGTFPKQVSLGPRLVVWVDSDIQNWISEQVSASGG